MKKEEEPLQDLKSIEDKEWKEKFKLIYFKQGKENAIQFVESEVLSPLLQKIQELEKWERNYYELLGNKKYTIVQELEEENKRLKEKIQELEEKLSKQAGE